MKITRIEPQKRNPKRENIFLDEELAFSLSTELRFLSSLHTGDQLTSSQVEKLIQKDQVTRLVEKSLRFLSFRPRSEKELTTHLLYKGRLTEIESEAEKKNYEKNIKEAVGFLKKQKQLDDREFAKWWIDGRRKFRKIGDQIIKQELFAKGVAKDLIEDGLFETKVDPFELAIRAAEKKLSSYQKLEPRGFKIKMGQYLSRRGFSWEVISRVVDTLLRKE